MGRFLLCRTGLARFSLLLTTALPLLLAAPASPAARRTADAPPPPRWELLPGDHISLIGNTLAERMQHDGWLETYLCSRFPSHDLVVRNLGFSGDELSLRLRSQDFGSPDNWLRANKTDVVFAFFGYNESFADKAGLEKFKKDLQEFIKHTRGQRYNGRSVPRLVLFSPIAHENLHNRNLPDGTENNRRLALYTAAMADVARAAKVPFVDLFAPTRALYARQQRPLTINGVHLNARGNEQVARLIDAALFSGEPAVRRDRKTLEKIREAVRDKNFYWFNRYRTTDGYSIYGGRADLSFVDGQTNRVVMQREMAVLDVMTANRDRRIWAVAHGGELTVDDRNTPSFLQVKTNKPGPLPGGKHIYLDATEAIKKMTVAKGMKVNLFASEKEFPELVNAVHMTFDPQGRLWVAVWPTYPHWKPKEPMNDKILILEDTKGTGKADKCTVFADKLHCPTGFELYDGGVLVAQAPYLWFLKDTKGTGKADLRRRVIGGLDSADTHHTSNSFAFDPGGAVYFQEGTFHHTQVETPWGPPVRCANAGVFRYEPRTQKFDAYVTYGFANPHGHVFDRWGQDIVVDGTGSNPYHAALFSGHLDFPHKHSGPPQVWRPRTRPCPGIEILSSRHFPEANQGNMLVANVIGFHGILQYKLRDDGASFVGTEVLPILSSTDENFRPSDLKIGPDGAIYFTDWHNPIIGHMQHNLRDPSRGREHGRIYRVSYPSRPLLKPVKITGRPVEKLLDVLKEPEDRVRYRARAELRARPTKEVIPAAKKWLAGLEKSAPDYEHHRLEALWLHQSHNVVNTALLEEVLASKDFRARAAATRVLCYWRDRVPNALDLLRKMAADPHPRPRLEAVRAASFFTVPEAIEVGLVASEKGSDRYIEFVRRETERALQPYVQQTIAAKRKIHFKTRAGARYFLATVGTDDLLKMERGPGVCLELLFRKGVRDEHRQEALAGLAKLGKKAELRVLLDAIAAHDAEEGASDDSVAFDLVRLLTGRPAAELAAARADLVKLATAARQPLTRQLGFVALIAADAGADRAWRLGIKSVRSLQDLVNAVPLVRDPGARSSLYPKVAALLDGLPKELAAAAGSDKSVSGRYVRVELPGPRRTLTLAEVEVYSDGLNVARRGKASQKNTAHGGDAGRAIDGNRSGSYGAGGQTHTQEGTDDPWWEVDLGAEHPIQSIVIYNRTDGNLGSRLNGFTLKVLDDSRIVVFRKDRNPAPAVKAAFAVGGLSPVRAIRRAAMQALPSMRGQEAEAVKALARFVNDKSDRSYAVKALQRVPARLWPAEQAKPVLSGLLAYVRKVPVRGRTATEVVDALQLADSLAALLPADEVRKTRRELAELGVRVIRLGTVVEQMIYDRERIVMQAGKPVEIVFENTDNMPHNLVIARPGALEEIGKLAERTATEAGAAERHYVPASGKILLSSRLLQPRETQRLAFIAPKELGVYPYVCTYPGHWQRMHGALYVVADLESYQAAPEAYLAKNPLPVADALLKYNRPRTEWKYDDLAPLAMHLTGRAFANGKQMFQVATCAACHKFGGAGLEFGPDLTKLNPKWTSADVLRHILEPSLEINEKYQSWIIRLESGKTITAMILKETPAAVELIENPLASTKPLTIKKSAIEKRDKSPTSIMPKGLLDKLTREEVLDLLAYVVSGADPKHKAFAGGGHDHGHGGVKGEHDHRDAGGHGHGAKSGSGEEVKLSPQEKKMLELLNRSRAEKKLAALKPNPILFKIARAHSENMARQNKMAHELDGKKVKDRALGAGYDYRLIGENVAWAEEDAEVPEVHDRWMKSKSHRDNILKGPYREVGLGVARSKKGNYYYTQVFGTRRRK
jgi:putative heme-binding domain-containing protein